MSRLPSLCLLRIERAEHHFECLQTKIGAFLDKNPYQVAVEEDATAREKVVRVVHQKPDESLSLIASDLLHNLRSCLDSLVYHLAGCPDDKESTLMFPIFGHFAGNRGYLERHQRYLKGVPEGAQTIIETLQPYHRPDPWDWPFPFKAEEQPLMLLHDFNRVDKHRTLHLTWPSIERLQVFASGFVPTRPTMGGIEGETEIFRVPINVDVNVHPTFTVTFDKGWPTEGRDVLTCLGTLLGNVRERILPRFVEFFDDAGVVIPERTGGH